nr:immunoglobulin heavy chain junction region [Macaca mulatta]
CARRGFGIYGLDSW